MLALDLVLDLVELRGKLVAVLEVGRLGGVAQRAEVVELGGGWAATEGVRIGGLPTMDLRSSARFLRSSSRRCVMPIITSDISKGPSAE